MTQCRNGLTRFMQKVAVNTQVLPIDRSSREFTRDVSAKPPSLIELPMERAHEGRLRVCVDKSCQVPLSLTVA